MTYDEWKATGPEGDDKVCGRQRRTRCESHGRSGTPEYHAWEAMLRRCRVKSEKRYADYGGRGIRVCDAWTASFAAFFRDVGSRPSAAHSLDRIDNDGHYEPGNVRWATRGEQMRNRRTTKISEEELRQVWCLRRLRISSADIGAIFGVRGAEIRRVAPLSRRAVSS